jgi:hypothetical protein
MVRRGEDLSLEGQQQASFPHSGLGDGPYARA